MSSMINSVRDVHGNTWIRCQECGDSKKSNRAHCMVDKKGSTYCFRCGHSTQLDIDTLIEIALGDKTVEEALEELGHEDVRPWSSPRPTKLAVYGIDGTETISFPMRDHNGKVIGWHDREPGIKGINTGRRGLGYVGETLTSTQSRPYIVVEGPYDVISDRHVCVFGLITPSTMKYLRMQYVWLQPDPDQIDTIAGRAKFFERVVKPIHESMTWLQGVIVGNADPDEATVTKHFTVDQVWEWR